MVEIGEGRGGSTTMSTKVVTVNVVLANITGRKKPRYMIAVSVTEIWKSRVRD